MKILTEREKKILINHAKKQELRRIISKKKKKNKRRYLQGKSKEERP
jgi:CRISPR/Cas system-associated protein Csx1